MTTSDGENLSFVQTVNMSIRRKRNALVFFFCGRREILDFLRVEKSDQLNKWTCLTMVFGAFTGGQDLKTTSGQQVDSIPLEGCPINNS